MPVNIAEELEKARKVLGERSIVPEDQGRRRSCISKDKSPEPLEKGMLRRKHEIYVFKDGTIRFDLTDVPLTHFRPREIGLSVEKALRAGLRAGHLRPAADRSPSSCAS